MFFVFFINFTIADKNVKERFLHQNMKYILFFMFEHQPDKNIEKLSFTSTFKNFHTGNRNTMAHDLQKSIKIKRNGLSSDNFLKSFFEVSCKFNDHGLIF